MILRRLSGCDAVFITSSINNLVIGWVILRLLYTKNKIDNTNNSIDINNLVIGWVILRPRTTFI